MKFTLKKLSMFCFHPPFFSYLPSSPPTSPYFSFFSPPDLLRVNPILPPQSPNSYATGVKKKKILRHRHRHRHSHGTTSFFNPAAAATYPRSPPSPRSLPLPHSHHLPSSPISAAVSSSPTFTVPLPLLPSPLPLSMAN